MLKNSPVEPRKEFADSFGLVGGRPEAMMGPRQLDQAALFYVPLISRLVYLDGESRPFALNRRH
jgi:hypothetical protein